MRPVLLDMHGFGSFREPSTVDFREVDYFVLVGPTGAGKSTVIDAVVFALYGSVPRWDDRKVVGLALAPSVNRGVVRLVFDVGGARYAVARDLRRSARGQVTVRNARLERLVDATGLGDGDTEVLAADGAVTGAVERLLGLTYDHFVTCVVLPQGDFAEFLHEKPAKRQEVLIRLLGLEVYQRVAQAANAEAARQRQRADLAAEQLSRYADATEEAERAARARIEAVERLDEDVRRRVPELVAAAGNLAEAERGCRRLAADTVLLAALRVPPGIDALDTEGRAVAAALAAAEEDLAEAEEDDAKARHALAAAGPRLPLERARDRWAERARLGAELPGVTAEHAVRDGVLREVETAGRTARAGQEAARAALDEVHRADHAAAVRARLAVGAPCPVCEQPVIALPARRAVPDLDAATTRLEAAEAEVRRLQGAWQDASRKAEAAAARVDALTGRLAVLRDELADSPDAAGVAAAVAETDRLEDGARQADSRLRQARRQRDAHAGQAEAVERRRQGAWAQLGAARDPLVPLGAPVPARSDLAADWRALADWAAAAADERRGLLAAAELSAEEARTAVSEVDAELRALLRAQDVPVPPGRPLAESAEPAVAAALERARGHADRIAERRAEAAAYAAARAQAEEAAQVARLLGNLLRADGFERWLLASALDVLVDEAAKTLLELSGGQFELTHDGRDFAVIDHTDADSRRPVRTLSGGETFQASLALALALSSQLAGLAAAGAARLDSIILDEGFGSLDEATLDTVASTLESLAAGGDRMIGVVTHVRALAERVPVRYAVRRTGTTSTVEREEL